MPGIVVGIDGSPNSERALDWAMKQAAALHTSLTAVAVHEVPKSYWGNMPVVGPADAALVDQLRESAEQMTHEAEGRLGDAKPASVTVRAVSGFAVQELVDASQDADMLVVGSRGGGGFAHLLVGSVSSQVIQNAACPVVTVPHPK
jgi:nucleotide-binding universal stress UspA family protein